MKEAARDEEFLGCRDDNTIDYFFALKFTILLHYEVAHRFSTMAEKHACSAFARQELR
jgi:hypothetical protein